MTFRVVLVEDDLTITGVIEILLSTEPDLELVGTATTAEDGIELVRELAPDLLLLDNQLAGRLTGVEAAPAFKDAFPGVVVLLCTALDLAGVAADTPAIDGYLRKERLAEVAEVARGLLTDQPGSA
jgi:DNA-binding NarL/FixJ family response regulator